VTEEGIQRAAWEHYEKFLQSIEQKRLSMPTALEIEEEFAKINQRIEDGAVRPDQGIVAHFNINTDYELKAGARYYDRNLRTRRLAALRAALPSENTRLVDQVVRDFVSNSGLDVVPGSQDWQALSQGFMRAEIEALTRSVEFDNGVAGGAPQDPMIRPVIRSERRGAPVSFKALFDDYIKSRQAVGYHRDGGANWLQPIQSFTAYLGHDDARRITREDVIGWRDSLLAGGLKAKTVGDKHLAAVRAVLRWAVDNARLDTDVSEKVKQAVPRKVQSREKGFTDEEAVKVLKSTVSYQPEEVINPSNRESKHISAAKRWVPLLCAFTGARVAEITQLRKEDVRQESNRWVLRITPDAGSVKTGQFRDVPLHRQVIALGFDEFLKSREPGPLFHAAPKTEKYLDHARTTASRLSDWLKKKEIVPPGVPPTHGWRHRFKTVGRELGLSDRVIDAIQGHAGRTAGDNYGDVTLAAKQRAIDALPEYELGDRS
jgi:integrase